MKILIFGSGGREHALAWAIARSPRVTKIVCAPGNGGIAQIARLVPVSLSDLDGMVQVAVAEQADLTVVGPELPLSLGIVDALKLRGLKVFGPTKDAAMLESSKGFAKRFLQRHPDSYGELCGLRIGGGGLKRRLSIFMRRLWSRPMGWLRAKAW